MGKYEVYYNHFGISKQSFEAYFKGCENKTVYALSITAGWVEQPTDLDIKPPQNYVFVNKE